MAVMLSIKPEWVDKIINGEKEWEIRKSYPSMTQTFKVYIYQTKGGNVRGEFICDNVQVIDKDSVGWMFYDIDRRNGNKRFEEYPEEAKKICLSNAMLEDYLMGYLGYAWHITKLRIYDKPIPITDFCLLNRLCDIHMKRPPQSWCYVKEMTKEV